ncbi:hypothetical protein D9758_018833 [Tetrapyrgos nigripes]|uniref:Uncharacterized protein n=1 Tax=Tetrapyrgos nigripes TaxID=182062 RepID=A0A8H5B980_9AGAR|nr:hypothetical protein D9758_018833 [Tetrapyrgos nigripes]
MYYAAKSSCNTEEAERLAQEAEEARAAAEGDVEMQRARLKERAKRQGRMPQRTKACAEALHRETSTRLLDRYHHHLFAMPDSSFIGSGSEGDAPPVSKSKPSKNRKTTPKPSSKSNKHKSKNPGKSSKPSKRRKTSKTTVLSDSEEDSDTSEPRTSPQASADEDESSEKDTDKGGICDSLEQRRGGRHGRKGPMVELAAWKDMARFVAVCHDPFVSWLQVIYTGLENDGFLKQGSSHNVPKKEKDKAEVLKVWDILKTRISTFDNDCKGIAHRKYMDALSKEASMHRSSSDAVSQDIRILKTRVLDWVLYESGLDDFDPPIPRGAKAKKSDARGWHHPQIARFLCTPLLLSEYNKDPDEFCQKVIENAKGYKISHTHFPAFFYGDSGEEASKGPRHVMDGGLFLSFILFVGWILLYLRPENEANWIENHGKNFKVRKCGKAWQWGIKQVTPRTMVYVSLMVRHALSSSDDYRTDDGAVIKSGAFTAALALFEDPQYTEKLGPWIELTISNWNKMIKWMLPDNEDSVTDDKEDTNSSLHQIAQMFQLIEEEEQATKVKLEEDAAVKAASDSSTPPTSDSSTASDSSTPPTSDSSTPPTSDSTSDSSTPPASDSSTPPSSRAMVTDVDASSHEPSPEVLISLDDHSTNTASTDKTLPADASLPSSSKPTSASSSPATQSTAAPSSKSSKSSNVTETIVRKKSYHGDLGHVAHVGY